MTNLIFFTQNTMASVVATREVLRKNHNQIKAIVLASQLRGESLLDQSKVAYKLIKNSSLRFFMYKLIESKLYHVLLTGHRLARTRRYHNDEAKTIENLAKKYNIPIIKANDLSDPDFLQKVKELNPDYILCLVAQILKKKAFETLGYKFINAHGSYLPEYRGPAQYIFYPLNGDKQFGITIHFMEPGLDTGDIIFQKRFDYDKDKSVYKLHYDISLAFGIMLNEFIENYTSRKFAAQKQNNDKATFTRMPLKEDIQGLKIKGYKLITIKDFLTYL